MPTTAYAQDCAAVIELFVLLCCLCYGHGMVSDWWHTTGTLFMWSWMPLSWYRTSSSASSSCAVPLTCAFQLSFLSSCTAWCRYGFNPGSAGAISTPVASALVGRSAVTTTIAAGTAGVVSLFDSRITLGHYNLVAVCNGILSGLVAITASCACVEPWAAMIIGASGALLFARAESFILNRLKIDDPLSASAMHGCIGVLGALVVGVFAKEEYLSQQMENASGIANPYADSGNTAKGLVYGGNGKLLLCQIIGVAPRYPSVLSLCLFPHVWLPATYFAVLPKSYIYSPTFCKLARHPPPMHLLLTRLSHWP